VSDTLTIRTYCMRACNPEITVLRVAKATGIHRYIAQALMHDMARRGELIRLGVGCYRRNPDFVPDRIALPKMRRKARPVRPSRALDMLQAAWR